MVGFLVGFRAEWSNQYRSSTCFRRGGFTSKPSFEHLKYARHCVLLPSATAKPHVVLDYFLKSELKRKEPMTVETNNSCRFRDIPGLYPDAEHRLSYPPMCDVAGQCHLGCRAMLSQETCQAHQNMSAARPKQGGTVSQNMQMLRLHSCSEAPFRRMPLVL